MKFNLSKNEIRLIMKSSLNSLSQEEYQDLNLNLYLKFIKLEILKKVKNIMIYYSVRKEVETVSIIEFLLKLGKIVALPVCTPEQDLDVAVINDLDQLRPAPYGLMEPGPGAVLLDSIELELVIVPGVAFDEKGFRLGHGAGYYDRFLSKIPNCFKMGMAYDFQLVPEVPIEKHDIPMDAILTPSRYLSFS